MSSILISSAKLHSLINNDEYRIIDCRFDLFNPEAGFLAFQENHIPGAVYADLNNDLSSAITQESGRHPLPTEKQFQALLQRLGISEQTHVIVYDDANSLFAARLWWLLKCYGHEKAQVLNGGINDYRTKGYALEAGRGRQYAASQYPLQEFLTLTHYSTFATEKALEKSVIQVVDVRTHDRYCGNNETIDPVAGHIKGALNLPFNTHLDEHGKFLPKKQLKKNFEQLLKSNKPLVFSCGSGVTACHSFLAIMLANLHKEAAIYPGSWSEWIKDPNRATETCCSSNNT